MDFLFSGNLLVVDLQKKEIEEEVLSEEFISRYIGGARANIALYEKYREEDPIVFGSGFFTGTPVPASCLGVVTGKSPRTGKIGHSPFNLYAGMELKLSGFDFIVVKGVAAEPLYLWVHDGLADLLDASELWKMDTWALTDELRNIIGEEMVQVLGIGEAGMKGSPAAQININYWASPDQFGFGAKMGEKNLKALALRGLNMLDAADPPEFNDRCLELHNRIKGSKVLPGKGFASFSTLLGGEDISGWLSQLLHRHSGCFACHMSCNTFVKYNESPTEMRSTEVTEPGILFTGLSYLQKLKKGGFTIEECGRILEQVSRLGLDPDVAADALVGEGVSDSKGAKKVLQELISAGEVKSGGWMSEEAAEANGQNIFSSWPPFKAIGEGIEKEWMQINALAYTCGICPVFMLTVPFVDAAALAHLMEPGAEMEMTGEALLEITQEILDH